MIIDPEFQSFIPPLAPAQRDALEAALAAAGRALDPLLTATIDGAETLLDGHNRYAICEARGLPYDTRSLGAMTRDEAKHWMFAHQVARRNLSVDQVLALAAARGVEAPTSVGTKRMRDMAADLAQHDSAALERVIASGMLAMRWGAWARKAGKVAPRPPRPPRGPSAKPAIPEGHELAGLSTLTDPNGETKAEWAKTRVAGAEPAPLPEGFDAPSRVSRMARGDGSVVVEWQSYDRERADLAAAHVEAWAAHAAKYRGLAAPVDAPARTSAELMAVYPLGDPHIGMLAWKPETGQHHDTDIATAQLVECMRQLTERTPPAERALIVQLGDFFHAEDMNQRTPGSGHKLDVDGRVSRVREAGYTVLRAVVDLALLRHRHVEVVNLPGNHDPNQAHAIAMWLAAVYEREPRVAVDRSCAPYFYREFGANLIAACHGDGAKGKDLPLLLAARQPDAWGRTRKRVWHVGHVHHTDLKEYNGARVWYHNTLAGKDYWHHAQGYDADQELMSITYDRDYGQDSTATIGIERVRAALAKG